MRAEYPLTQAKRNLNQHMTQLAFIAAIILNSCQPCGKINIMFVLVTQIHIALLLNKNTQ